MSAGTQVGRTQSHPDPINCLLALPASEGLPVPAMADSLNRRGAVVRVDNQAWLDEVLDKSSLVDIQVGLPALDGKAPRLMHCIGHVVSKSLDRQRRVWLVLRFSQVFVQAQEESGPGVEAGQSVAFSSELEQMRRGACDPTIAVGGQPGATPGICVEETKGEENA